MSTSCSAGVNFYYWIKPLAVTGLQRISKRLVSLVSNREVGRVRNGGGSFLDNLRIVLLRSILISKPNPLVHVFVLLYSTWE